MDRKSWPSELFTPVVYHKIRPDVVVVVVVVGVVYVFLTYVKGVNRLPRFAFAS